MKRNKRKKELSVRDAVLGWFDVVFVRHRFRACQRCRQCLTSGLLRSQLLSCPCPLLPYSGDTFLVNLEEQKSHPSANRKFRMSKMLKEIC